MTKIDNIKRIITKAFGDCISDDPAEVKRIIDESVKLPEDDRGEWAPESHAVIYHEMGLPGMFMGWPHITEKWLSLNLPDGMYVESINGAVSAVY